MAENLLPPPPPKKQAESLLPPPPPKKKVETEEQTFTPPEQPLVLSPSTQAPSGGGSLGGSVGSVLAQTLPTDSKPFSPEVGQGLMQGVKAFEKAQGVKQAEVVKQPQAKKEEYSFTPEGIVKLGADIATSDKVANSFNNFGLMMEGFEPRLNMAAASVWKNVLGEELANKLLYTPEGRDVTIEQQLAADRLKDIEARMKEVGSITKGFKESDPKEVAAGVLDAGTSMLYSIIIGAPTGGATLATDQLGQFLDDYNKNKAENLGIKPSDIYAEGKESFAVPALLGTAAAGLELFGMKGVMNAITNKVENAAMREAGLVLMASGGEGTTEWVQTGLQTFNDELGSGATTKEATEKAVDMMFSEQGLDAALKGAAGSGSIIIASKAVRKITDSIVKGGKPKTEDIIQAVEAEIESGATTQMLDASVINGDITEQQANEVRMQMDEMAAIYDTLPAEAQGNATAIAPLIMERNQIYESIDQLTQQMDSVDEAFAPKFKEQIDAATNRVQAINEEILNLSTPKTDVELRSEEAATDIATGTQAVGEVPSVVGQAEGEAVGTDTGTDVDVAATEQVVEDIDVEFGKDASTIAREYINSTWNDSDTGASEAFNVIMRAGIPKIKGDSFNNFVDKNKVTKAIAQSYFNKDGRGIDEVAAEMTNDEVVNPSGIEITPDMIGEFMLEYPNGAKGRTPKQKELNKQYMKLTGKSINSTIAKSVLKKYNEANPQEKANIEKTPMFMDATMEFIMDGGDIDWQGMSTRLKEHESYFTVFPFGIAEEDIPLFKTFIDEKITEQQSEFDAAQRGFAEANEREGGVRGVESKPQLTAEVRERNLTEANELGWDNVPQALASIKKRTGEAYATWDEVPQAVREKVSNERNNDRFTAKGGNKIVNEKGQPLVVYRSTYNDNNINDGVNYFAEDAEYSKKIASIMNRNGKSSDYVEERPLRTIAVNIAASRVYELPKGEEMNGNKIKSLTERDPDFTKEYDAVKGIDLYSDNKIVYAVFDKSNIKELDSEQSVKEKQDATKESKQQQQKGGTESRVVQPVGTEKGQPKVGEGKGTERKAEKPKADDSDSTKRGEEVDLTKLEAKTQVQVKAKADLKAALAKLNSFNNLGVAFDPMQNAKQDLEWWNAVRDAAQAAMKLLAVNTDIGFEKFQGKVLNSLKKNSKAFDALSEDAQRDLYAAIVEPTKQYIFTNRIIKSLDKGAKDLMKSAATLSATEYEQRVKSLQDGFKAYIDDNKTRLSKYANNRLLAKAGAIRSPQSLQAAIKYADKIIENGEFRARVENAVALQKKLSDRINSGDFTNIKATVKNLVGYDLSELPADGKLLDRYIDIVNDLVNNKTPKFESLGQLNELAYDMQMELTFDDQSDMEYDPEEKGDPATKVFEKMEKDLEKLEELNTDAMYSIGDVVTVQRLINSINGRIEYLSTIVDDTKKADLARLDAASARVIDVQKGSKEVMERIMRDTNEDANTLLTQAVKEQDFGKESNAVMETVKGMKYIPNAAFIQARYDAAVAMSKGFMPPRVQVNVVHKYNALRKIDGIYKVIDDTRKMVEKADKLIDSTKIGKLFNKAAQRVGFGMKPLLSYEQIEEITDAMSVIDVKLIEADLALSGKAFDLAGTFFVPNTELETAANATDKIYKEIEKAAVGLSEKERIRVGFYMLQKNQDAIYGDKSINVGDNQFSKEYIDKWGNKGTEKRAEQQEAYDSLSKGANGKVDGKNLTPKEREFADAMLKISETTLMPMAKFTAEQIQGQDFIELPEYYPLFYFQTRDVNPTQKINDLIMGGIANPRYKSTRIEGRKGGVNGLVEVDPLIAFAKAAQDVVRARYLLDARLQSRAYISAFNAKAGHKAAITEAIVRTSDNKLRTELMRQDINKAEATLRTVVRGVGSVFLGGSIERPLAELTSALFQMTYQFSKNPKLVMKYLNRLVTPQGQQAVRNLARFAGSGIIKSDNAINMEVASYGEPTMMQRIRTIGRGYDKAAKAAEELVRKSSSLPELVQGGFTLYPMYLAERFEQMTGKPLDLSKIEGTYEQALPYLKENAEAIKDASEQAEQQVKMEVRTTSRGELAENVPTLFGKFNRKGMVAMLTHFLNGYMRGQAERHRQKVSALRYKNAVGEPSFSKANMKVKAEAFADLAVTDLSIFAGMLSYNAARGVYVGVGAALFYAIKYMLADDEEEEKTAIQGIDESIKEARDAASPQKMIAEGVSALAWFLTGRYGSEAKLALAGLLYTKVGDKNAVDVMAESLADEGATEQEIAKMRELVAASASEFTRKKEWRIMKDDAFTTIAYGMLPPLEYMDRQRREVSKDMEALGKVKIGNTTIGEDKDYTVEMSKDLEGVLFFRAMSKVATGLALAKGTSVPALGSVNRWVNDATGAKYRLDTDFMLPKDGKGGITVLHTMNKQEFEVFQSEVNKKLKETEGKLWTKEYSDLWMEARKEAQFDAWEKVEPMMQRRLRGQ